jgi:hypothetical protein
MAMGAFLAGVLLASSEYRHALESDIEPFKGLLLGLFFIGVGMSIDFGTLVTHPLRIVILLGFPGDKNADAVAYRQAAWRLALSAAGLRCCWGRGVSSRLWSLAPRGWRRCWTANGQRR